MKLSRYTVPLMLVMAALLAVLGAACGGDDDAAPTTAAATTTGASSANSTPATTPAKEGGSASPAASAKSGGNEDALATLRGAVKDYSKASFKVTYDFKGVDDAGKEFAAKLTTGQKPPKNIMILDGDFGTGTPGTITFINDGTDSFMCTADPQKTCIKTGPSQPESVGIGLQPEDFLDSFTKDIGTEVKEISGQKVAGRDGKCYSVKSTTEGTGTLCVDKKTGLLLLVDATTVVDGKEQKVGMKATAFDDNPSDNDFKPPYPVSGQ